MHSRDVLDFKQNIIPSPLETLGNLVMHNTISPISTVSTAPEMAQGEEPVLLRRPMSHFEHPRQVAYNQSLTIPAPGDPIPSFRFCRQVWAKHEQTHTHTYV